MIAEKVGTHAYRQVGRALSANPRWPHVPCHRVVGSDGRLTGFSGGLAAKQRLLEEEEVEVACGRVDLKKHLYFP